MTNRFGATAAPFRAHLLLGAAAIGLASPSLVHAQTAQPDADEAPLEEEGVGPGEPDFVELDNVIIVTATKREQTLQETPISVSVTSGEVLEQAQIRDVIDLQTVAPSLTVSQLQSSSNTTFLIRGFGNGANNLGIEPSVGVFIDGVFRSRTAGSLNDLANVQRIEVLRGPQSTLFGKNASAGVISVVTRRPLFDFGGSIEASYGNYDNIFLRGDVTGPITDTIAFSIDGSLNKRDGYGTIVNLDEDINDRDRWTTRGQLLFEPTTDLSFRLIGDYSEIDEVCCIAGNVLDGPTGNAIRAVGGQLDSENLFSYDTFLNIVPVNEIENYGVSLQGDWDVGAFSLTSITAYRELSNFFRQDIDFTSADLATEFRDQAIDTFTQELRLASDFDGPVNFLLGGFYFNESIEQESGVQSGADFRAYANILTGGAIPAVEAGLGIPAGASFAEGPSTVEFYQFDNEAWSIFGTVDFEPVDGLVLTAGFNYTDDEKDFALEGQALDPFAQVNFVDAVIVGGIAQGLGIPPSQVTPQVIAQFQAANPAAFSQIATVATTPCSAAAPPPACNNLLPLQDLQFLPPFLGVPNAVEDGRTSDDDWSYTLRAAYDIDGRVNVYLSYATGFKASSVNLSRDSRPAFGDFVPGPFGSTILAPPSPIRDAGLAVPNLSTGSRFAGPEEAKVWEVGVKAQFDRFGFNLALFDQTLEGFQDFLFTGTGFQLSNAGERSAQGFEFDTTINPVDALVLTFALTYLDSVYDSFVESPVGDLSGETPGSVSPWTIATAINYVHEFGASGNQLVARVDYNHQSNTQLLNGVSGFGSTEAAQEIAELFRREVNLVNAALTFQMANGFEIGAFARNLLDDQYIAQIFPSVAQAGSISGYPSAPRTYGGVIRFNF
jgi:outer membrane receptor protein involved in Fe transport